MKNIEIEVRSFISAGQYKDLGKKLNKIAKFLDEINEETVYCGSEKLRIRKDDKFSYLILKSGKIHDDSREEIEIKFGKEDFEKMKSLVEKLGFKINVIWLRKRKVYDWKGTKVLLDDTKGYGKIIELEKIVNKKDKGKAINDLKTKLSLLEIKKITPKSILNKKFEYYIKNWRKLI